MSRGARVLLWDVIVLAVAGAVVNVDHLMQDCPPGHGRADDVSASARPD
jgi:hypothetical protein